LAERKEQIEEENNAQMASKPYLLTVDGARSMPSFEHLSVRLLKGKGIGGLSSFLKLFHCGKLEGAREHSLDSLLTCEV